MLLLGKHVTSSALQELYSSLAFLAFQCEIRPLKYLQQLFQVLLVFLCANWVYQDIINVDGDISKPTLFPSIESSDVVSISDTAKEISEELVAG